MRNTTVEKIPRPAKELRDQAARDKILQAASACVVRSGFHGASMADIAKAARMSVGQIYRYFASKEAIVHGIVERIVESRLQWINTHHETRAEMPEFLAQRFAGGGLEFETREEQVLMLEVMAEATRNPEVAQILRGADSRLRAKGLELIQRACPEFSEQQVQGVLEVIGVLAEGTAIRRVTGLQSGKNMGTLISMYRDVLEKVLAPRD